jgi:hypothetical protein
VKNLKNIVISKIIAGKKWLNQLIDIGAEIDMIITLENNNASDGCSFDDIAKKANIPLLKTDNINSEEVKNELMIRRPLDIGMVTNN